VHEEPRQGELDEIGLYATLFELAGPFLDTRHNEVHATVSCRFARELLTEEGGDPEVVLPAIILHDVGWKVIPEEKQLECFGPYARDRGANRIHEVEGARIATAILERVEYDPAKIRVIANIISGHDSRLVPISLEDQIVKDADKLFRFSEEGFAIDCGRFALDPGRSVAGLRRRIDSWLFTDTAKRVAHRELDKIAGSSGSSRGAD